MTAVRRNLLRREVEGIATTVRAYKARIKMNDTGKEARLEPLGAQLFPHELQALLDALRRDLRMETLLVQTDAEWAAYHYSNVRLNVRLLELLEPGSAFNATQAGPAGEHRCGQAGADSAALHCGRPAVRHAVS
jgi:hypothetical protein